VTDARKGDEIISVGNWGTLIQRGDAAGTINVIPHPDIVGARREGFAAGKAAAVAALQRLKPVGLVQQMFLTAAISAVDKAEPAPPAKPGDLFVCRFGHGEFRSYELEGAPCWCCPICGEIGELAGVPT
jgi:hypothetical protein